MEVSFRRVEWCSWVVEGSSKIVSDALRCTGPRPRGGRFHMTFSPGRVHPVDAIKRMRPICYRSGSKEESRDDTINRILSLF